MVVTLPLEQSSRLFTRQIQLIFPGPDLWKLWEDGKLKTKSPSRETLPRYFSLVLCQLVYI